MCLSNFSLIHLMVDGRFQAIFFCIFANVLWKFNGMDQEHVVIIIIITKEKIENE